MRTFIAIELPQEIRTILSNIQDELKQTQADVKWVKPENIHLTLKFLGEIGEDLVLKIQLVLKEMAEKISSIKQEANELKAMSGGIQAVDKNVDRILASVKMLEINISDLIEVLPD